MQNREIIPWPSAVPRVFLVRATTKPTMASSTAHDESAATTTVSVPGKVLLAGGYLVLESPNVGLVVAADKRFYCSVSRREKGETTDIVVRSPQFHASWNYQCLVSCREEEEEEIFELRPTESNSSENGFVEKTLRIVLAYLWQCGLMQEFPSRILVVIRADNDFYSVLPHLQERGWDVTPENVDKLPKCLACPIVKGKAVINKTGLGSSAALVTSLVGALLESFGAIQLQSSTTGSNGVNIKQQSLEAANKPTADTLQIAHNLAQICHCHAQGKVGSGFDVSSAVFGSHVYRRFPKCILPDLLGSLDRNPQCVTRSTAQTIHQLTHDSWSGGVQAPLNLPQGLELLLADVCGGSESPSMARKVLTWKQSCNASSEPYWENLSGINERIVSLFHSLSSTSDSLEKHAATLSRLKWDEWKTIESGGSQDAIQMLLDLRQAFQEARTNLKAMGDAAGVPIEPPEQTALADATMKLPGVLAAMVPGAGGYDALACLYVCSGDGSEARNQIGKLWASWGNKDEKICPLGVQSSPFGNGLCTVANFKENC